MLELLNIESESTTAASVRYRCAMAERGAYMLALTGGIDANGDPRFPASYPYNVSLGLVVKDCTAKPLGELFGQSLGNKIILEVTYGTPKKDDQDNPEDPENPEAVDLYSVSVNVSGEQMQIPNSKMKWGSGASYASIRNQPLTDDDVQAYITLPSVEVEISSDRCRYLRTKTIAGLAGRVNSSVFRVPHDLMATFAAGTVLFMGSRGSQKTTNQGVQAATRSLSFLIRDVDSSIGLTGWNCAWCSETNRFEPLVGLNGGSLYRSGNFSPLFDA